CEYEQHIFGMTLDMMIDGIRNSVSTLDIVPIDEGSVENLYRTGFTTKESVLKEGISDASPSTSRTWKIFNPSSINQITKHPVAWKLISNNNIQLMAAEGSFIWEKAGFTR